MAGPDEIDMLAAALRADLADLDVYARVLTRNLADALPPEMVTIERERSLSDRLTRRPGTVALVRVHTRAGVLELAARPGSPRMSVAYQRGEAILARREVSVAEWVQLLAAELRSRAADSAAARDALARLLER